MSIPVKPTDLAQTLEGYGDGYLLSTSAEGRTKAVTITARIEDGVVVVPGASKGTSANLAENPAATLLFPPPAQGGYTLLVDGRAEAGADGFRLRPDSAVLHRPATEEHAGGGECGNDCIRLEAAT